MPMKGKKNNTKKGKNKKPKKGKKKNNPKKGKKNKSKKEKKNKPKKGKNKKPKKGKKGKNKKPNEGKKNKSKKEKKGKKKSKKGKKKNNPKKGKKKKSKKVAQSSVQGGTGSIAGVGRNVVSTNLAGGAAGASLPGNGFWSKPTKSVLSKFETSNNNLNWSKEGHHCVYLINIIPLGNLDTAC
nr:cylicin-2-like [Halyomorpha halys]